MGNFPSDGSLLPERPPVPGRGQGVAPSAEVLAGEPVPAEDLRAQDQIRPEEEPVLVPILLADGSDLERLYHRLPPLKRKAFWRILHDELVRAFARVNRGEGGGNAST